MVHLAEGDPNKQGVRSTGEIYIPNTNKHLKPCSGAHWEQLNRQPPAAPAPSTAALLHRRRAPEALKPLRPQLYTRGLIRQSCGPIQDVPIRLLYGTCKGPIANSEGLLKFQFKASGVSLLKAIMNTVRGPTQTPGWSSNGGCIRVQAEPARGWGLRPCRIMIWMFQQSCTR